MVGCYIKGHVFFKINSQISEEKSIHLDRIDIERGLCNRPDESADVSRLYQPQLTPSSHTHSHPPTLEYLRRERGPIFYLYTSSLLLVRVSKIRFTITISNIFFNLSNLAQTLEFCFNVLAGIIASTIFIQERGGLQPSVYICVGIIIGLKVLLLPSIQRKIKEEWL